MADARFCVGFSSACKQAREGGGLPGDERGTARGRSPRPWLPPEIVRLIDALVRRLEHEDTLLSMNGGGLGTTLCQAATAGGLRDVRFLLARGADVHHMTVYLHNVEEEGDADADWTALRWAAKAGRLDVCAALLDAGAAELDLALFCASYEGHTPVVALLLDRGADVHFDEDDALVTACFRGHLATATLLLDRGADVHAQDDEPLTLAAEEGHLETVRLLLDRGALAQAQDNWSLRMAALSGRLEIAKLLLDRGANIQSHNGRPLLNAALSGQLEMVRFLLDRGANIHADNEAALCWARRKGHAAVIDLLLERGALEPEEN